MRRSVPVGLICLLVFTAVILFAFFAPERASSARLFQDDIPLEGWRVCEVGGMIYIPEIGVERQMMHVCHGDGWRYQAYCLQPLMDPPALNTMCSILENHTVWCGDDVQQLRLYALLEIPEVQDTPTPTHTSTSTSTSTATATATVTATATTTATGTTTATATFTATSTSTITPVAFEVTETATPTRTETPYVPEERPRPGGPGNVEAAAALAAVLATPIVLGTARVWALRKKKPGRF